MGPAPAERNQNFFLCQVSLRHFDCIAYNKRDLSKVLVRKYINGELVIELGEELLKELFS